MATSTQQSSSAFFVTLMPVIQQTSSSPFIMSCIPLIDTFPNTTYWSSVETWIFIYAKTKIINSVFLTERENIVKSLFFFKKKRVNDGVPPSQMTQKQ